MRLVSSYVVGLISALFFVFSSAVAADGGWKIVESAGAVRAMQPMATMQLVSTGDALSAGAVVTTGADGRAVLARGEQQIVVGPNSRMSLPAEEQPGMTRILQDVGTLLFKVDKRKSQHFRVETPVIAAVVKGTTFTVTAGADAHTVHVAEGAVEVSSRNGADSVLVTAGRTAHVLQSNPGVIQFDGRDSVGEGDANKGDVRKIREGGEESKKDAAPLRKASFEGTEKSGLIIASEIGAEPLDVNRVDGRFDRTRKQGSASCATPGIFRLRRFE